jgi:flavin reductase (DIM6/NTAB) family NADH-FMN oxidoreductase RutF
MTIAPTRLPVDPDTFRRIMSALAGGVAVVTTVDEDGEPRGLTSTAVTAVSLDPPLLLACVGRFSRTLPAIRYSGRFTVNLIESEAAPVAVRFASKDDDKFADAVWRPGRNGCPVLHGHAIAWAECRVEREVEAGDHVIFIGAVEHGAVGGHEQAPLTYFRSRFGTWASINPTDGGIAR